MISRLLFILFVLNYFCFFTNNSYAFKLEGSKKKSRKGHYVSGSSDIYEFKTLIIDAIGAKNKNEIDKSVQLFTKALNIFPTESSVYNELSKLHILKGSINKALYYAEKATELDSTNKWYKLNLANLYSSYGNLNKAIEIYNFLLPKFNDKLSILNKLVFLYQNLKKYDSAINFIDKIEHKIGYSDFYSNQKINNCIIQENKDCVIYEMKKKILNNKSHVKNYTDLLNYYLTNNYKDSALIFVNEIIKKSHLNKNLLISVANYYLSIKNKEGYLKILKNILKSKYINIKEKMDISELGFSFLYVNKNDTNKIVFLIDSLKNTHNNPNVYNLSYKLSVVKDSLYKAEEDLKKSLYLDKTNKDNWLNIIDLYLYKQNYNSLDSVCSVAIETFPLIPDFYYYKGISLSRNKHYDKSIFYLKKGLRYSYEEHKKIKSKIFSELGFVYFEKKSYDESFNYYEKALKLSPNDPLILNNYGYFLSIQNKNLEKARKMSQKSNILSPNNSAYQDTYAWILYRLGNYNEAYIWSKNSIKSAEINNLSGNRVELFEHHSEILIKLGKIEEAIIYLNKIYEVSKDQNIKTRIDKLSNKKTND